MQRRDMQRPTIAIIVVAVSDSPPSIPRDGTAENPTAQSIDPPVTPCHRPGELGCSRSPGFLTMATTTSTDPASAQWCYECEALTVHANGQCVECAHDIHREKVAMMRLKRKVLTIGVSAIVAFAIMWAMAQDFSKDDVIRGVLVAMLLAVSVWFSTSLKSEEKIRSGDK
jgi:hypothetical protein